MIRHAMQTTDLKNILATHAHGSYVGGTAELKRQSGARVYAHEREIEIIEGQHGSKRFRDVLALAGLVG